MCRQCAGVLACPIENEQNITFTANDSNYEVLKR